MNDMEFMVEVVKVLGPYLTENAIRVVLKVMTPGALVAIRGGKFQQIFGTVFRGSEKKERRNILGNRIAQTQELFTTYANEPNPIAVCDTRIAYAHKLHFVPGQDDAVLPDKLKAVRCEDYDVDTRLGISGYKKAAEDFRVNRGDRRPEWSESAVRISAWERKRSKEVISLSRAEYLDQFVTSQKEIVDIPIREILKDSNIIDDVSPLMLDENLRKLGVRKARLPEFKVSLLSNTIGIAATVVTSDGYLIVPRRNTKVHVQPEFEGCSVSGVLQWSEGLFADFIRELKNQLLGREGPEEIGLRETTSEVIPLAFARELERAGKPQFFFHVWASQILETLRQGWENSEKPKEEYDSIRWVQLFEPGGLKAPEEAAIVAAKRLCALVNSDTVLKWGDNSYAVFSEEARANMFYLAAYLRLLGKDAFPASWVSN